MKKAENKIKTEFSLPHPLAKTRIIGVFANDLVSQAKDLKNIVVIKKDQIDGYKGKKKQMKALARKCYSFLAEAPLMPSIGKIFGPVLAVRGKMPKPIAPTAKIESLVERARNTTSVALKASPVVQLSVGSHDMEDEKIAENIEKVLQSMMGALPKGREQLGNLMIKTTMGKPERIDLKKYK